jgi:cell division protease FtsH
MTPEDDRFLVTKNELMARITGYLGGRTSEEIFFEDISTGAHNDIEVATRIARAMVVEYGMSSLGPIQYEQVGGNVFLGRDYTSAQRNFSQEVALAIDKEIRHIVDTCHAQARKVIEEHRDDLILIANTLLERESITAEQIDYLLKYRTLDVFPAEPQQNAEILEDVTPIEPNSGDVIDE